MRGGAIDVNKRTASRRPEGAARSRHAQPAGPHPVKNQEHPRHRDRGREDLRGVQTSRREQALCLLADPTPMCPKATPNCPSGALAQPTGKEPSSRQQDKRLKTKLSPEALQKRLLDIWYDARTLEEEQGINILYLSLGLLKWFEDDKSDVERYAPLVLLPVRLERSSAADRFYLASRSEPPSPNLSLQAKMDGEFGLKIEDFGDEDDVDIRPYLAGVAQTVSGKSRWEVKPMRWSLASSPSPSS